jgi:ADP-dependent NAD(P)H-hydrate dehydratase / NAD(P)H-hydrate epimerase
MKIVTAAEMREIDHATSERFGVPSLTLMENAGSAVARFILSDYPEAERVGILCGKGNNGGDGFVVARKLVEAGRAVRVLLLSDPAELRGDAAAMFHSMLQKLQPQKIAPLIVRDASWLDSAEAAEIFAADVIVDAILGTGFRPPVSPLYAAAIDKMNAVLAPIVAVDIPSGADADAMQPRTATGSSDRVHTEARADAVVTFTVPRPAHVFAALVSRPSGPTVIAPIGSPSEAIISQLGLHLSTPSDFAPLLAPRARDANKGSYGHVLVIGGSLGKAGAAAMAGFSALRAGAGLSTVATPKSVLATVAAFHPELMTEPLAETEQGTISLRALESSSGLDALLKRKTLAIGPGISRNSETAEFVREVVKRTADVAPMVVDADALNAFEGAADQLNGRGRTLVITPHPGEMARLTGLSIPEIQANRHEVARNFAREHDLIVVLKGHRTLIAAPTAVSDGAVWVNPTGNPGMATGGTGDILTGIIAGLIAQHPQHALEATALAVYLHGLAGDMASASVGENCMVATDLVRFLPQALAEMRNRKSDEIRLHA